MRDTPPQWFGMASYQPDMMPAALYTVTYSYGWSARTLEEDGNHDRDVEAQEETYRNWHPA